MKNLFFALLFSACCLPTSAQRSAQAQKVIDRYLEAIGGEENWRRVTSIKKEISAVKFSTAYKAEPSVDTSYATIYVEKPDRVKSVWKNGEKLSILALDGEVLWSQFGGRRPQVSPVEDVPAFKSTMVLIGIEEHFLDTTAQIAWLGEDSIDGKKCDVLRHTVKIADTYYPKTYFDNYFDQATGLLLCQKSHKKRWAFYKDYAWQDGLLFFYKEENYSESGKLETAYWTKKIEVNPQFDEGVFKLPEN